MTGTESQNVDIDVDALMDQIRGDIGARLGSGHASGKFGPSTVRTYRSDSDGQSTVGLTRFRVSAGVIVRQPSYALDEFLAYHDEDFIVSAYRGLLGREPDAAGASRYLDRLRTGDLSKVEVLGRIRFSTEGRGAAVTVRGLKVAFALRTIRRTPIVGSVIGVIQYVVRLPRIVRNHERLEAVVFFHQRQIRESMNAVEAEVEAQLRGVQADSSASRELVLGKLCAELATVTEAKADKSAFDQAVAQWQSQLAASASATARFADELKALDQRLLAGLMDQGERLDALQAAASPQLPDSLYVKFEDHFRGTQSDIRQRMEIYLPYVHAACIATGDTSILDIGCGRGEWLNLLTEREYRARGVDLNSEMVAHCKSNGLDVVGADALDHLHLLEPGSLSVVTAVHVIEHLPFQRVMALFDGARRVLRPGGMVIFETPNPENLVVGACNFWYDPTHRRPLPPEPMRFVLGQCGFSRVEILRLHPVADAPQPSATDALTMAAFDRLYGAQDYALIGYN